MQLNKKNKSIKKKVSYVLFTLIFGVIVLFILNNKYGGPYKAGAYPDRILLSWIEEPSKSMSVTWRCQIGSPDGKVQYTHLSQGPDLEKYAQETMANQQTLITGFGIENYYAANMTGLQQETTYAYRVGNGNFWSEWNYFKTASPKNKPFSFIFMGDVQYGIRSSWSRVVRKAYSENPNAAFILYVGDIVRRSKAKYWGEWFDALGFIHKMMPCFATPGNHEYRKGKICKHWRKIFDFPKNGPQGYEDLAYYFDYQGARFIFLDSNVINDSQTSWLEQVLKTNDQQWTIVAFHHPLYFVSKSGDPHQKRNIWLPIFEKYNVDLILLGHDHTYIRSKLIRTMIGQPRSIATNENSGIVYIVSVAGAKMYPPIVNSELMERVAGNTQLYQVISINGNRLNYEAKTADGALYDAFTLDKLANGNKKLTNKIPAITERK